MINTLEEQLTSSRALLEVAGKRIEALEKEVERQGDLIKDLTYVNSTYKHTLDLIANVNAMDYEYQSWAEGALVEGESV